MNGDDDKPDLLVGRSGSDDPRLPAGLTNEPTAPGEDVMCQNNLKIGDDFIIIDYKPTESVKADDNFLVVNCSTKTTSRSIRPTRPSIRPTRTLIFGRWKRPAPTIT